MPACERGNAVDNFLRVVDRGPDAPGYAYELREALAAVEDSETHELDEHGEKRELTNYEQCLALLDAIARKSPFLITEARRQLGAQP